MSVLVALTLALLGFSAWWVYKLDAGSAAAPTSAGEMLAATSSATVEAASALAGNSSAYADLEASRAVLEGIRTSGLSEEQRARLGQVRGLVKRLLDGRGEVELIVRSAEELNALVPEFSSAIYALEGTLNDQRQPAVTAQLERLRILAESLPFLTAGLLTGGPDVRSAAAGQPDGIAADRQGAAGR